MDAKERTRRHRARLRGEDVPKLPLGPKPGFKQSPEHVRKRKRWGSEHHSWIGDEVSVAGGRSRAERLFPLKGPCESCGAGPLDRHHIDQNPTNNHPNNIAILCRKCHMAAHKDATE